MPFTRRAWAMRLAVIASCLLIAPTASAESSDPNEVQVLLNGRSLQFDVPPIIDQGVTMVPVRAVLTPLGATFTWEPQNQRVVTFLNGTRIEAVVGQMKATVNGEGVPLLMPVANRDGRTLIPLRFFAEELGFGVRWEGETRTVYLQAATGDRSVSREATRRTGDRLVELALQQIGRPYAWGGTTPESGFDCSGLITYLGAAIGQETPRTSYDLFATGTPIGMADLVAGDLVFFSTYAPGASHVGVYDGAGGFIHAQSPEVGVVQTPLSRAYWAERYLGARRIFR